MFIVMGRCWGVEGAVEGKFADLRLVVFCIVINNKHVTSNYTLIINHENIQVNNNCTYFCFRCFCLMICLIVLMFGLIFSCVIAWLIAFFSCLHSVFLLRIITVCNQINKHFINY